MIRNLIEYRYVGADLSALISESSTVAVNRIIQDLQGNGETQMQSLEDVNNVFLVLLLMKSFLKRN